MAEEKENNTTCWWCENYLKRNALEVYAICKNN